MNERVKAVDKAAEYARSQLNQGSINRPAIVQDPWVPWQDDVPTFGTRMEAMEIGDPRRVELLRAKLTHCLEGNRADAELDICNEMLNHLEAIAEQGALPQSKMHDSASRFFLELGGQDLGQLEKIIQTDLPLAYRSNEAVIHALGKRRDVLKDDLARGTAQLGGSTLGVNATLGGEALENNSI